MGKVIVLIVSVLMPQQQPDIQHMMRMESFEACWAGAKDFLSHELSDAMREKGAIGLSAACAYQAPPSQTN